MGIEAEQKPVQASDRWGRRGTAGATFAGLLTL